MNSSLPCIARGELTVVAIGVVLADAQTFLSSMPYDTRVTLCCSDLDVLHMPYRIHDCPAVMNLIIVLPRTQKGQLILTRY